MGHSSNAREIELPMCFSLVVLRQVADNGHYRWQRMVHFFPLVYCSRVESLLECVLVVYESHGAAGCCSYKRSFNRRVH